MIIAKVKGQVISSTKTDMLTGLKLMVVVPVNIETFEEAGAPLVSIDTVGCGIGELVMVCGSSSSRLTEITTGRPADNSIVGIIDYIDMNGKCIFEKYPQKINTDPDQGNTRNNA
jgi:ethanolamine utilization protein EutN/carbon dioxide concentrating mechanism protein CcmL